MFKCSQRTLPLCAQSQILGKAWKTGFLNPLGLGRRYIRLWGQNRMWYYPQDRWNKSKRYYCPKWSFVESIDYQMCLAGKRLALLLDRSSDHSLHLNPPSPNHSLLIWLFGCIACIVWMRLYRSYRLRMRRQRYSPLFHVCCNKYSIVHSFDSIQLRMLLAESPHY